MHLWLLHKSFTTQKWAHFSVSLHYEYYIACMYYITFIFKLISSPKSIWIFRSKTAMMTWHDKETSCHSIPKCTQNHWIGTPEMMPGINYCSYFRITQIPLHSNPKIWPPRVCCNSDHIFCHRMSCHVLKFSFYFNFIGMHRAAFSWTRSQNRKPDSLLSAEIIFGIQKIII